MAMRCAAAIETGLLQIHSSPARSTLGSQAIELAQSGKAQTLVQCAFLTVVFLMKP